MTMWGLPRAKRVCRFCGSRDVSKLGCWLRGHEGPFYILTCDKRDCQRSAEIQGYEIRTDLFAVVGNDPDEIRGEQKELL